MEYGARSMNATSKQGEVPRKQLQQFGWLMGGVFLVLGLWPLFLHAEEPRIWALIVSGVFGLLGLVWPQGLKPIFRGWMFLGEKVGWFNSRVLLGIVFFLLVTPIGWLMSLLGKRPLQLGFDSEAETYRVVKSARSADHVTKPF